MKKILMIDVKKCTGCRICELVCSLSHDGECNPLKSRIRVFKIEEEGIDMPCVCQHCETPLCRDVCPVDAIVRDSDTGAIVIKEALCVGCRACTLVCPYGAITMDTYRGVMLKCDLCSGDPYLKHVVVVDDDVDVYNETEVLWAISTRVQADEDVFIVAGVRGSDLDPSAKEQGIVTKVGIDATRTLLRPFPSRLKVPEKVMNKMKLEDFLE